MNYQLVICKLYYLLAYADGSINDKEAAVAKQMIKTESISDDYFNLQMNLLNSRDKSSLYTECVQELRKLDEKNKIKIVAWMCVVANADGFMDRAEWQLIYKIYHKELGLPLNEIFSVQKELNKLIWGTSMSTATIL
jgi:uncharacterized tellurite resistance protein B-like protein